MESTYLMLIYFNNKNESKNKLLKKQKIKKIIKKSGVLDRIFLCFKKKKHVAINDNISYLYIPNNYDSENHSDHIITYHDIYTKNK